MIDSTFIIGSALCPLKNPSQNLYNCVGSIFTENERFEQTIQTIESIDKYCPNNIKYLFDCSPNYPPQNYFHLLEEKNVNVLYVGNNPKLITNTLLGNKSAAESIGFYLFLDWYKKNHIKTKRIYKISGRYKLNSDFKENDDIFKDSFVFLSSSNSHLCKENQIEMGVDKFYSTRLFHMDYNCLDLFYSKLPSIIDDCEKYIFMNSEHSYYKHLHEFKVVEVEKIGVEGFVSPTNVFVKE